MVGISENGEQPLSDEQALIRAARRGDLNAFNALVLRYQDSAYTVAYRILGEAQAAADAAQESFIVAYRRLETYRGGSFKAWVLRIVTNQCYDELRRQRRRPVVSMEDLGDPESDDGFAPPDPGDTPEQTVQQRELERAIQNCINALSPDQRIVLVLSDIEEMAYQDIADNVGANLGTVKSRLSRARAAVRDCLQRVRELLPGMYRLKRNDD
jgi:RNA polymerase sigma factor (sigma-70 family)